MTAATAVATLAATITELRDLLAKYRHASRRGLDNRFIHESRKELERKMLAAAPALLAAAEAGIEARATIERVQALADKCDLDGSAVTTRRLRAVLISRGTDGSIPGPNHPTEEQR